jgi:hypothetical protein
LRASPTQGLNPLHTFKIILREEGGEEEEEDVKLRN